MLEAIFDIIDFGYDSILGAYNNFFSGEIVSKTLIGFKVLAIALFLLSIYSNMLSRFGNKWNMDGETIHLPYNPNKLLTSLIFVLLIAFYDKLLFLIDSIFLNVDQVFLRDSSLGINIVTNPIEDEVTRDWTDYIKAIGQFVLDFANGKAGVAFVSIFHAIAKAVDAMIFGIFLIERFFMLGLLKMLGPFAIAISIYKAGSEMFMKWLKLYIATFLLIIPFFLVLGFTSEIFTLAMNNLQGLPALDALLGSAVETVLLIFIIWVKIKLFKKSYDMVYKVIA